VTQPGFQRFRVTFRVCTPLHIGSGMRHAKDYDFTVEGRPNGDQQVRLIDVDVALDMLDDSEFDSVRDGRIAAGLPRRVLERAVTAVLPVHGSRNVGQEILAAMRDGLGQVYIPGSSLKGAFRSALLDAWMRQNPTAGIEAVRGSLGGGPRRRESAARDVEQQAFDVEVKNTRRGSDFPNRDVNRWLRISDAYPSPERAPALVASEVQVRSGSSRGQGAIPVWVEAIAPGSTFSAELTLAPSEFAPWNDLDPERKKLFGADLVSTLRSWGDSLRQSELDYWKQHDNGVASRFAGSLLGSPVEVYFPLGFGTGWVSKTIGRHLRQDQQLLSRLLSEYQLSRSRSPDPSTFPVAHRVIDGPGGWLPLGWVAIHEIRSLG
jgi:CRISPR type III-A-associated RAMP protein Csm5